MPLLLLVRILIECIPDMTIIKPIYWKCADKCNNYLFLGSNQYRVRIVAGNHFSDVTERDDFSNTGVSMVCSAVWSGADQNKHQSSASLAFVRGNPPVTGDTPRKGPVTRKMFPFDGIIMGFVPNRRHALIWCNDDSVNRRRYASQRGWFNIHSYQYRKSHCWDKGLLRLSYFHNEISYTGKTAYLYWIKAQASMTWSRSCHTFCYLGCYVVWLDLF